jgi:hypothetical protein
MKKGLSLVDVTVREDLLSIYNIIGNILRGMFSGLD